MAIVQLIKSANTKFTNWRAARYQHKVDELVKLESEIDDQLNTLFILVNEKGRISDAYHSAILVVSSLRMLAIKSRAFFGDDSTYDTFIARMDSKYIELYGEEACKKAHRLMKDAL